MLKYIKKITKFSLKKIIFVSFSLILFLFLIKQSLASAIILDSKISNSKAIEQMEKVLLAPENSIIIENSPKINIQRYSNESEQQIKEDPDFASNSDQEENILQKNNPDISIEIIKKMDSNANRLKETAAYNAFISGQYEVALELYKQILIKESSNNYAKFGLATSYHKLKQYEEAKKHYYDLLSSDIDNKNEVIANFIEILIDESPNDAKYILARLSAQSPNTDFILARAALSYDKMNQKNEAILLLKRALSLKPNNLEYQINLAILFDKNKEFQSALKYYKRSLRNYIELGENYNQINLALIRKRINFLERVLDNNS